MALDLKRFEWKLQRSADLRSFADAVVKYETENLPAASLLSPMETLLQSRFLTDVVNAELERMAGDGEYICRDGRGAQYTLFQSGTIRLGLQFRTRERAKTITGQSGDLLIGCIGPGPLRVTRYEQQDPFPVDVIDRTKQLTLAERLSLKPGKAALFRTAYDVPSFEEADAATGYLTLRTRRIERFYWSYDAETLLPKSVVSAVTSDQRLEFALKLAALAGNDSISDMLTHAYNHPAHNIRWAIIETLIAVDPIKAHRLLALATTDVHPHVRQAAAENLPRFEAALKQLLATPNQN